jgi:hypothetical protein
MRSAEQFEVAKRLIAANVNDCAGQHAGIVKKVGCVDVSMHPKHWPCLFPQHGPGRKHNRRIALEPWQRAIVDQETKDSSSA